MQKILTATNNKLLAQSDLVVNLQVQTSTLQTIIDQKNKQIEAYDRAKSDLEKALRRERRTKKLYKIGSTIGAAAILLNVLGK